MIVVPRGLEANCRFRKSVLEEAARSLPMQKVLLSLCKADIDFWISTFVYQVNPRHVGNETGPFIPYPHQQEAVEDTLRWLSDGDDVIWEKSRYQGATWLMLLMQIHRALFFEYKKFLDISHTENAVDSTDDPDSLFWKVQFVLEHLPDWMRRDAERSRRGIIKFPGTKSTMTGSATSERSGVGGRATWVGLDEFAKQKNDFEILGQTADTGPRHFVSTHYGIGTAWHSLTQRPDIKKVILHWSDHPEMNAGLYRSNPDGTYEILDRTYEYPEDYPFVTDGNPMGGPYPGIRSVWYDRECARRQNARDIAMHLDIDVKGSVSQYFPAQLIYRLRQRTSLWLWEGDLSYDTESGQPHCLVERVGGPLRLWMNPTAGGKMPPRSYVFGCDIANGMGATPSCISIFEAGTGRKIGEYANAHILPDPFAVFQIALARLFNDGETGAFLIWERQGPGEVFARRVIQMGYRHFYYKSKEDGLVNLETDQPGYYPTPLGKKLLFDQYIAGLVDGGCTNPSDRSLEQCLDFRYDQQGCPEHPKQKNNKVDPSSGGVNHGDIVMADALAWKVVRDRLNQLAVAQKEDAPVGSFAWRRELRKKAQAEPIY